MQDFLKQSTGIPQLCPQLLLQPDWQCGWVFSRPIAQKISVERKVPQKKDPGNLPDPARFKFPCQKKKLLQPRSGIRKKKKKNLYSIILQLCTKLGIRVQTEVSHAVFVCVPNRDDLRMRKLYLLYILQAYPLPSLGSDTMITIRIVLYDPTF